MIFRIYNSTTTPYYTPTFSAKEKTFVIIKPDAFERHLDQKIMDILKQKEISITRTWEGFAPKEKFAEVYKQHANKSFFTDWISYLAHGKIRAMEVEGEDAINTVINIKRRIRSKYAPNEKRINLMHCSDDTQSAKRETRVFFNKII